MTALEELEVWKLLPELYSGESGLGVAVARIGESSAHETSRLDGE